MGPCIYTHNWVLNEASLDEPIFEKDGPNAFVMTSDLWYLLKGSFPMHFLNKAGNFETLAVFFFE